MVNASSTFFLTFANLQDQERESKSELASAEAQAGFEGSSYYQLFKCIMLLNEPSNENNIEQKTAP
jgi:hypothetical protein